MYGFCCQIILIHLAFNLPDLFDANGRIVRPHRKGLPSGRPSEANRHIQLLIFSDVGHAIGKGQLFQGRVQSVVMDTGAVHHAL